MADDKKGTVYQQLNKLLNLDGFGFNNQQSIIQPEPPKIIIKGIL